MSLGSLVILAIGLFVLEVGLLGTMKSAMHKVYLASAAWLTFFAIGALVTAIGLVGLSPMSAGFLFLAYGSFYVTVSFAKMCYYALKGNTENAVVSFIVLVTHAVLILGGLLLVGYALSWPWVIHLFAR